MNLFEAFQAAAAAHPDRTAIFRAHKEFSYRVIEHAAMRLAERLQKTAALAPGDRVALWMRNRPEFVPSLFGIWQRGAVAVPINSFLKPNEASHILRDSGAKALLIDAELAAHEPALRELCPNLTMIRAEEIPPLETPASPIAPASRTASDLAVLIYTSGTTGRPKGAMLSHGNLLHNVDSCRTILETTEDDRMAVLLPLFHSYMLTVGILMPLLTGASMVLVKSLSPMKAMLEELLSRQPTILPGIPQLYRSLVQSPLEGPLPIRVFISGSAPLPLQVLNEFEQKFHTPLLEGYGLSEASPVVSKNPLRGQRKAGSVGLPIPNVEMSVQDADGNHLPPGAVGEICVRGGNVMQGYWNQPGETDAVLRNGWLLTGDLGRRDEEGYYYITDRKKDMLLVNGINVYPREIEETLHQFPGVKEAAVVGVPDPKRGERPIAFIAALEGATPSIDELRQFLKNRLADYKQPREIRTLAALPRNATGKVLKTELRNWAAKPASEA